MSELKDLLGKGLVMFFEKDGRFIPIQMRITDDRKPIITISATKKLGQELEKKSLQAVREFSENLQGNSKHSVVKESTRIILYLR
jgi:hypothetical protein